MESAALGPRIPLNSVALVRSLVRTIDPPDKRVFLRLPHFGV